MPLNKQRHVQGQRFNHPGEQDSGPQDFSKTLAISCKGKCFVIIFNFVAQFNTKKN